MNKRTSMGKKKEANVLKKVTPDINPYISKSLSGLVKDIKNPFTQFWLFDVFDYNKKMPNGRTKLENLYNAIKLDVVRYIVFQSEICPETKNKHLQGYIELSERVRRKRLQEEILKCGKHWCQAREDKNNKRSISYCQKPNRDWPASNSDYDCYDIESNIRYESGNKDMTQGNRSDLDNLMIMIKSGTTALEEIKNKYPGLYLKFRRNILSEYREYNPKLSDPIDLKLYEWQEEIMKELNNKVVRRKILWIWSKESETGKSTFSDYVSSKIYTYKIPNFKWVDIIHNYYENHKVIWINLPREKDELDENLVNILEKLSDGGVVTSGKFEGIEKKLKAHIVVTSNSPPPNSRIPKRIIEYEIGEEGKLKTKIDHRYTKQECEKSTEIKNKKVKSSKKNNQYIFDDNAFNFDEGVDKTDYRIYQ